MSSYSRETICSTSACIPGQERARTRSHARPCGGKSSVVPFARHLAIVVHPNIGQGVVEPIVQVQFHLRSELAVAGLTGAGHPVPAQRLLWHVLLSVAAPSRQMGQIGSPPSDVKTPSGICARTVSRPTSPLVGDRTPGQSRRRVAGRVDPALAAQTPHPSRCVL
jgi:hypothetical protein